MSERDGRERPVETCLRFARAQGERACVTPFVRFQQPGDDGRGGCSVTDGAPVDVADAPLQLVRSITDFRGDRRFCFNRRDCLPGSADRELSKR